VQQRFQLLAVVSAEVVAARGVKLTAMKLAALCILSMLPIRTLTSLGFIIAPKRYHGAVVSSLNFKPNSKDVITLQPVESADERYNPLFIPTSASLSSLIQLKHLKNVVANAGYEKASRIQELSFAPIMAGEDVIVGAETGSGKTLAYFLPLINKYLASQLAQRVPITEDIQGSWEALVEQEETRFGVILAPSAPLCEQVMGMIGGMVKELQSQAMPIALSECLANHTLIPFDTYYMLSNAAFSSLSQ
jgi:hypothetical protein